MSLSILVSFKLFWWVKFNNVLNKILNMCHHEISMKSAKQKQNIICMILYTILVGIPF